MLHDERDGGGGSPPGQLMSELGSAVIELLKGHQPVVEFAKPARFSSPVVNRFDASSKLGRHRDVFQVPDQYGRTMLADLAYSLVLSDSNSYQGGDFELGDSDSVVRIRPNAGALIAYSGNTMHSVAPIEAGKRISVVGWIESLNFPDRH
ncbi:MAG: 2OG-Fe(II) oxygenase [Quisquiliibacterium sp.]